MYKIERKSSGYLLTFGGNVERDEMERWRDDSKRALSTELAGHFGVIVDMRDLKPLAAEAQKIMVDGQKLFKEKGMKRSAVVLNNSVITLQFKRLARDSGIYEWERYIDASKTANWVDTAIAWVRYGRDPDR